jgi:gpW
MMTRKPTTRGTTVPSQLPLQTPAQALLKAQQQMFLLLTGQMPMSVETPQLGRVEYSQTSVQDLQRLIDYLNQQVAAGGGDVWVPVGSMTGNQGGRKPFSIMAWP